MLVKVLIFALVGYALYRLIMNDHKKKSDDSASEKERLVATGDMARDPVCGAYVETSSGIKVRNGEDVTYFCSYECRDKYLKQLEGRSGISS